MMSLSDWAPLIGAGFAAAFGLFLLRLSVREAHSGSGKDRKGAPEAGE